MSVVVFGNNQVADEIFRWLLRDQEQDVYAIPEREDLVKTQESWERPFEPIPSRVIGEGPINAHYDALQALQPKWMFGCRSRATVSEKVLSLASVTNLHYGYLPQYAGCHPIPHAILNGDKEVGITLHWMAPKLDAGPIIAAEGIPIVGKTHWTVYQEANQMAVDLFKSAFPILDRMMPVPQDLSKRVYHSNNSIDWSEASCLNAADPLFDRKYRAFFFPPKQVPVVYYNYRGRSRSVEEAHFQS